MFFQVLASSGCKSIKCVSQSEQNVGTVLTLATGIWKNVALLQFRRWLLTLTHVGVPYYLFDINLCSFCNCWKSHCSVMRVSVEHQLWKSVCVVHAGHPTFKSLVKDPELSVRAKSTNLKSNWNNKNCECTKLFHTKNTIAIINSIPVAICESNFAWIVITIVNQHS